MSRATITGKTTTLVGVIGLGLCTALPVFADDWVKLDASGIAAALTGRTVQFDAATQDFRASGKTLYVTGQDSWGNWTTRGDQYCSQWPPSAMWTCYALFVSADGSKVRFSGAGDDVTVGVYVD